LLLLLLLGLLCKLRNLLPGFVQRLFLPNLENAAGATALKAPTRKRPCTPGVDRLPRAAFKVAQTHLFTCCNVSTSPHEHDVSDE
jgi:hypothetical protein